MKKVMFMIAAVTAFAACQSKNKPGESVTEMSAEKTVTPDSICYQGEVPAADGPGIRYELSISNDGTDGYSLKLTTLAADNGNDLIERYSGTIDKKTQEANGTKKTVYKLGEDPNAFYLLVVNDSTLRLVNRDLEESVNPELNYDLKLVK